MDAHLKRPRNELSAAEIATMIAAGETTAEAVLRDCLARIALRDGAVKAFVNFDPELALAEARALDRGPRRGPLHGVPVGVKDIIDTFDFPTEMGSPIFRGHRPSRDAACVALLRRAGAVILGKTVTCEFAGSAPSPTTNPHNAAHTPGGSSAGSAAAVADRMLPVALGTQTGGSVLRPSSFCGIFGYKPTYNIFNKAGVWPAADSIDTIGLHARSIEDIALFTAVLRMQTSRPQRPLAAAPRIGLCRTELWDTAQDESKAAVESAAASLGKAGAEMRDIKLPDPFIGLPTIARGTINFMSARPAWPSPGIATATRCRRKCGVPSRTVITRLMRTMSPRGSASMPDARYCRRYSRKSIFSWCLAFWARRRKAWRRPATPACRRCGPRCIRRASRCRPIAVPTICRSASNWWRSAMTTIGYWPARNGFGRRSARRNWSA